MNCNIDEILDKAKTLIKDEMSELSFKTWIEPLRISSIDNNKIYLIATDSFKKDSVESRYKDLLTNAFNMVLQRNCEIYIILNSEDKKVEAKNNLSTSNIKYSNSFLNPNYSFDTFVVGDNNRFAHAAALAVAEAPATAYNPLFLYGGVGLGKTHLMHAIGNEVLRKNNNFKVVYVTSEVFTNEFINSVRDNSTDNFRKKYRDIDVLLIDDIQFIAGKEKTQEELFHTFNFLKENNKQIVLSSDRPPRDILLLEDRLKSRFEWGILADVSMADYETRLAILRKKTQEKQIIIDDDILKDIATKIDSNIRELEGVFNKLVAQSSLTNMPITIEMAEIAINSVIKQKESIISIDYIQEIVCKYFDINTKDLKSSQRSNDIAFPRQIGMYLCRILTNESFPKIGESFGNRDHTTVMHAFKKIEKEIKEKKDTKLIVESVKKIILNNN
ncbi:MAG: chromosomal replication initiator protein DnaA [Clostridia bacterium]